MVKPLPEFVAYCIELLQPLGAVRARAMFGGHGLYLDDLFVAIVVSDRLYLKADDAARPHFEAAGCQPFVYEAEGRAVRLNYWTAPDEALDSAGLMAPWVRLAVQAAWQARAGRPHTRRSTPRT